MRQNVNCFSALTGKTGLRSGRIRPTARFFRDAGSEHLVVLSLHGLLQHGVVHIVAEGENGSAFLVAAHGALHAVDLVAADEETFIIGGGMIYRQFEPLADKLYITHIRHSFPEADTFFPLIDPAVWTLVASEDHPADEANPYPYTFAEYIRK